MEHDDLLFMLESYMFERLLEGQYVLLRQDNENICRATEHQFIRDPIIYEFRARWFSPSANWLCCFNISSSGHIEADSGWVLPCPMYHSKRVISYTPSEAEYLEYSNTLEHYVWQTLDTTPTLDLTKVGDAFSDVDVVCN